MTDENGLIERLELAPHPEGGYYRQTWVAPTTLPCGRPTATAILFLLRAGEISHWHKVDADELWIWQAGAQLPLRIAETESGPAHAHSLAGDPGTGAPQCLVPAGHWQSAGPAESWTLVSCIVSPGFRFEGFTLAEPGFDIPCG